MSAERVPNPDDVVAIRKPPARTPRRRAQQITKLAQDLLEDRLRTGTASPTEVVAGLRLASETETANVARIQAQTEYLIAQKAKAEAEMLNSQMLEDAMAAISEYQGRT